MPAMDAPVGAPTPQGWRESANQARGSSTASLSTSGRAPVLTLASGRGGVGKTAIAALLAAKAAQWGMSVALVDLDLSCGNLGSLFGVRRTADLARLGASGDSDLETMGRCNVRCANNLLLWGPCERPELAETVMPHVGPLLDYLSCRYDLVVVDTSTTFTEAVALAAQRADRLMLVYVGGDEALGRLGRTSALAVRLGVARTRIVRVENLADPRVRRGRDEEPGELRLDAARPARVLDGYEEAAELLESGGADELARSSSACASSTAALLARTLSELGCLPDVEEARRLARPERGKRRLSLFSKRREVRS